jgi:hypothetical protein
MGEVPIQGNVSQTEENDVIVIPIFGDFSKTEANDRVYSSGTRQLASAKQHFDMSLNNTRTEKVVIGGSQQTGPTEMIGERTSKAQAIAGSKGTVTPLLVGSSARIIITKIAA